MSQEYEDLDVLETIDGEEMTRVIGGRRGADDPPGHVRGGGKRGGKGKGRGGADDPAGHA